MLIYCHYAESSSDDESEDDEDEEESETDKRVTDEDSNSFTALCSERVIVSYDEPRENGEHCSNTVPDNLSGGVKETSLNDQCLIANENNCRISTEHCEVTHNIVEQNNVEKAKCDKEKISDLENTDNTNKAKTSDLKNTDNIIKTEISKNSESENVLDIHKKVNDDNVTS